MNPILLTIAIIGIIVYVWTTIKIYDYLKSKSDKIESPIFLRFYIFKYLSTYKSITKSETGKIGYLFYLWIISINLTLLCILVSILIKSFIQ
jgi:hypothetical protein